MFDETVRQQYQKRANAAREWQAPTRPKEGWIRTLRKALGMSGSQLATRLGVKKAQVSQMELMELEDRITLRQLRKAADALQCDLTYALVPRQPVEEVLRVQAARVANDRVMQVHVHMTLEAQQLSPEALAVEIERETERLLRGKPGQLWE